MSVEHTKKVVLKEETQQEFVSVSLWELTRQGLWGSSQQAGGTNALKTNSWKVEEFSATL